MITRRGGTPAETHPCLVTLLALDGQVIVIDEHGDYWVQFKVRRVAVSKERPHGLDYSLTLHGKGNERLVGLDNAHAVRQTRSPGGKGRDIFDHKERLRTIRPYEHRDAASLLEDFWKEVDSVLREKGVLE